MARLCKLALLLGAFLPAALAAPMPAPRQIIPGKYIVTLKQGASLVDVESHMSRVNDYHSRSLGRRSTAGVEKVYQIKGFNAYSGEFDAQTIEAIKNDPSVYEVEEDQVWTLHDEVEEPMSKRDLVTQTNSTWGLASISHRFPNATSYLYDSSAGAGGYAYVVDTGIQLSHSEFGGRATFGYNAFGEADTDTAGHGTHVTGTILGSTYGVSKQASAIAVKVFGSGGSTTAIVMDGFTWAVNDIISKGRQDKSVINMSLGGGFSSAFNAAVDSAFAEGVLSSVSAGNSNRDASTQSPASAAGAVTVGSVDSTWTRSYFSNYGPALDIWAPGSAVLSSWIGDDDATNTISGTSMAAPHVSGVILYLQSLEGGDAASITARLRELATPGKVADGMASDNFFLYNGIA